MRRLKFAQLRLLRAVRGSQNQRKQKGHIAHICQKKYGRELMPVDWHANWRRSVHVHLPKGWNEAGEAQRILTANSELTGSSMRKWLSRSLLARAYLIAFLKHQNSSLNSD
jgi:hypothetical protein